MKVERINDNLIVTDKNNNKYKIFYSCLSCHLCFIPSKDCEYKGWCHANLGPNAYLSLYREATPPKELKIIQPILSDELL